MSENVDRLTLVVEDLAERMEEHERRLARRDAVEPAIERLSARVEHSKR